MKDSRYRYVSVKQCKVIGSGSHGRVYKLNDEQIIKVYTDGSSLEDIENERLKGREIFLNGVQSAITFDTVITEYGYGVIFELAGIKSLGKYVSEHRDEFEECAAKFADFLYEMNHLEADTSQFPSIKELYRAEFSSISTKYLRKREIESLIRILDAIPDENGYIHGDYHPRNVRINEKGELTLIDMADISCGNGFFDVGGSYLSMVFAAKVLPKKTVKSILGMDPEESQRFWRLFLSEYYKTKDPAKLAKYESACRYFSFLRLAKNISFDHERASAGRLFMGIVVRWKLLAHEEECIDLFRQMKEM